MTLTALLILLYRFFHIKKAIYATTAKVRRSVALFHHAQRNSHRECKDNYNTSQLRINAVRFTFVLQLDENYSPQVKSTFPPFSIYRFRPDCNLIYLCKYY